MANPFSKRAQRYSDTLTRFYGLRFEKGFMLVTNSLCLGHCKHRDNILKKQCKRAKSPTFCTRNPFHVQKATVFAHTSSVVEGTVTRPVIPLFGPHFVCEHASKRNGCALHPSVKSAPHRQNCNIHHSL